ncbi:MAG: PQQ-binding-like beta-propeller repeat protein [Caulobacteraceae bacterium]
MAEETISQEALIDLEEIDRALLGKLKYEVANEKEIVSDFTRDDKIIMDKAGNYSALKGITCFRGNNYRDSASFGYAEIKEKKLEIQWQIPTGGIDGWTGVGWNGQPSIVEWPEELRSAMNIREEKKNKENLREVIYEALDGKVYFLDLEDGSSTRDKIQIPGPVKGSLTVDPRGIPLLYVGHGINTVSGEKVEMGYWISGNNYQGIESSVAAYKNLAYFADNGGWLQCIDLNTLRPVWIKDVTDDTDSTIVIDEEEENEQVSLYTACEVDKQGTKRMSYIRKIDALSGKLIWEKPYECFSLLGDKPINGGALATPAIGKNSLKQMAIYNLARYGGFNKGLLVALNKITGEELWRLEMPDYSWSSPVAVYTEEGDGYLIQCDSAGRMYLIDGLTGRVLDVINLGANVEGSPAVFENMVVVGTRGQKIFGIRIS